MMPIQAMRLRKNVSSAANSVSYRDAGSMVLSASATSIAIPVSALAAAGDLLVCVLMRRSTAATPPTGWARISNAGPFTNGSASQYTDVYTKTAVAGDLGTSPSFGQTTTGRLIGQILALTGTSATPVFESQATGGFDNMSVVAVAIPTLISSGAGRLALGVASSLLASQSPSATTFSVDNGWSIRSTNTIVDNRLGFCTKSLGPSQDTSGTIASDVALATNGMTANAVIFAHP